MASSSVSAALSSSACCRRWTRCPSGRHRCRGNAPHPLALPSSSRLLFPPPRAFKRFSSYPKEVEVVPGPRRWVGNLRGQGYGEDDDDEDDDDEEEEDKDRSLDLLVRFMHSVFRKISRRARKAVRGILPPAVPTTLVRFSVNGVLILASLWIVKSFLEVVCTFGSMVFVSILLVRGIWSGISYVRVNRDSYLNTMDNDDLRWDGIQAA